MKIGIIGLGLIGGSIFKDLRKLEYDVVAVSKSQTGNKIYKDYEKAFWILKRYYFQWRVLKKISLPNK